MLSVVEHISSSEIPAPTLERAVGTGPVVLICDHATRFIPASLDTLGLSADLHDSHIVWDPGALDLAQRLSVRLDAPLIYPGVSRLVIDCNRVVDAADSIVPVSENISVPGNLDLPPDERARRKQAVYDPFHHTIDDLLETRREHGMTTALVAVHSFTPVFHGKPRPWQVGVIFEAGNRFGAAVCEELAKDRDLCVGVNKPYSPGDGVYHTVSRHKDKYGLAGVMLEIRNDLLRNAGDLDWWADRLEHVLRNSLESVGSDPA